MAPLVDFSTLYTTLLITFRAPFWVLSALIVRCLIFTRFCNYFRQLCLRDCRSLLNSLKLNRVDVQVTNPNLTVSLFKHHFETIHSSRHHEDIVVFVQRCFLSISMRLLFSRLVFCCIISYSFHVFIVRFVHCVHYQLQFQEAVLFAYYTITRAIIGREETLSCFKILATRSVPLTSRFDQSFRKNLTAEIETQTNDDPFNVENHHL